MPIYEYSCSKCGKTVEVIQKMSDKPLTNHGGCGGKLTKLISAAGFQFKGTGWYVTDYAGKGKPPNTNEPGGDSSKESKSDTSSTDSKAGSTRDKPAGTAKSEKSPKSSSEKPKKS